MGIYQEIWQKLMESKRVAIVTHKNPDLDTLGSAFGLHFALEKCGKHSYIVAGHISPKYHFLDGINRTKSKIPKDSDLIVAVDVGDKKLLADQMDGVFLITIDHHKSNDGFGDLNLIRSEKSSTGEVVFELLEQNSITPNKKTANALLASIADDTEFFTEARVDSSTFSTVAKLLDFGADYPHIIDSIKNQKPLSELRLTAKVLENMQLFCNGELAISLVGLEELEALGADAENCSLCANLLLSAVTVKVALLLYELPNGLIKGSFRSSAVDVSQFAEAFGGGGHKMRAGFRSKLPADQLIDEAKSLVSTALDPIS